MMVGSIQEDMVAIKGEYLIWVTMALCHLFLGIPVSEERIGCEKINGTLDET